VLLVGHGWETRTVDGNERLPEKRLAGHTSPIPGGGGLELGSDLSPGRRAAVKVIVEPTGRERKGKRKTTAEKSIRGGLPLGWRI